MIARVWLTMVVPALPYLQRYGFVMKGGAPLALCYVEPRTKRADLAIDGYIQL
jgi:hypothetical protein